MQQLQLEGIDTIIFDLGKVIINLDMDATYHRLEEIYGEGYEEIMTSFNAEHLFTDYETGQISTQIFVNALKSRAKDGINQDDIITAWNAMLGDIPQARFDILLKAKERYSTYCLSNTNELHINWIENWLESYKGIRTLDPFFHKVYYSHEMGQRKPEVEIFETLINAHQLNPSRTVFIDDTAGHLIGARQAGLNTFHLTKDLTLEDLFEGLL